MGPTIDHIEITVKDMSVAVQFYDKLLPTPGLRSRQQETRAVLEDHELHVVEYLHRLTTLAPIFVNSRCSRSTSARDSARAVSPR